MIYVRNPLTPTSTLMVFGQTSCVSELYPSSKRIPDPEELFTASVLRELSRKMHDAGIEPFIENDRGYDRPFYHGWINPLHFYDVLCSDEQKALDLISIKALSVDEAVEKSRAILEYAGFWFKRTTIIQGVLLMGKSYSLLNLQEVWLLRPDQISTGEGACATQPSADPSL